MKKHKYFLQHSQISPVSLCLASSVRVRVRRGSGAAPVRDWVPRILWSRVTRLVTPCHAARDGNITTWHTSAVLPRPGGYGQNGPQSGTSFFRRFLPRNIKYTAGSVVVRRQRRLQKIGGGSQLYFTLTDHNPWPHELSLMRVTAGGNLAIMRLFSWEMLKKFSKWTIHITLHSVMLDLFRYALRWETIYSNNVVWCLYAVYLQELRVKTIVWV